MTSHNHEHKGNDVRQNLNQSEINEMVEAMESAEEVNLQPTLPNWQAIMFCHEVFPLMSCEDDGQPSEYDEWQDYMGGDEYYDHSENEAW